MVGKKTVRVKFNIFWREILRIETEEEPVIPWFEKDRLFVVTPVVDVVKMLPFKIDLTEWHKVPPGQIPEILQGISERDFGNLTK